MREVLQIIAVGLVRVLFCLAAFFVLLVLIAHSGWVPEGHALTMFTFVQPIWTVPFAAIAWVCARKLQSPNLGRAVLLIQALSVLFFEDYNFPSTPEPIPTPLIYPTLKVMAWNVQYYDFGLEKVVSAIKEQEPDVVLLSEHILTAKQKKHFEELVKPYKVYTGPFGDAAILTRLPVLQSEEVALPSRQTNLVGANLLEEQVLNPRRSFVRVRVAVGSQGVDVISVRFVAGRAKTESPLDAVPWGMYLWATQRREVRFFTDYIKSLGTTHFVFGGDLNAPPSSWSLRQIRDVARDTYMEHHWYGDATFRSKIFRFQKKKNMPMIRLDYLFASPEVITKNVRIEKINLSDHDALIGEYLIPHGYSPHGASSSAGLAKYRKR